MLKVRIYPANKPHIDTCYAVQGGVTVDGIGCLSVIESRAEPGLRGGGVVPHPVKMRIYAPGTWSRVDTEEFKDE